MTSKRGIVGRMHTTTSIVPMAKLTWAVLAMAICLFPVCFAEDNDMTDGQRCKKAYINENAHTRAERCEFVSKHCHGEGMINFYHVYYCSILGSESATVNTVQEVFFFSALAVGLFVLFRVLGTTADDYFAPTLTELCREIGLPPRFAGVTFLALASGAPDVSSTIAAVREGNYMLSLGALTGAGMFVTCIVAGGVMVIGDGAKAKGALCREVASLMFTSILVLIIFYSGKVTDLVPVLFLLFYFLFCFVVLGADIWHRRKAARKVMRRFSKIFTESFKDRNGIGSSKAPWIQFEGPSNADKLEMELSEESSYTDNQTEEDEEDNDDEVSLNDWETNREYKKAMFEDEDAEEEDFFHEIGTELTEYRPLSEGAELSYERDGTIYILDLFYVHAHESFHSLVARVKEDGWNFFYKETLLDRINLILEMPFVIARVVTVPAVDGEIYFKPFFVLSCMGAPFWLLFCWYSGNLGEASAFQITVTAIVSVVLFIAAILFCPRQHPPKVYLGTSFPFGLALLCLFSFCVAATWINLVATELVNVITFIGSVSGINDAVLGLTVIAWGNSIGDFSTNMAMARKGLGNMSMTASFAGPLFNILVGLGLGFTLYFDLKDRTSISVQLSSVIALGLFCIILNCIGMLITSVLYKQQIPKSYGFFGFFLYIAYICVSIIFVITGYGIP